MNIERIHYTGTLPESFFSIPAAVYSKLPFTPAENSTAIASLFSMEADQHDIIIYTDHNTVRLVGMFPKDSPAACFGFWETVDDLQLHQQVFAMLEADARKRSKTTLVGPLNFNTYHSYRLRLGGLPSWIAFDREPVNPIYYPFFLEQSDFHIQSTFESRLIRKQHIPDVYTNKAALLQALSAVPFDFIPLDEAAWQLYEEQIYALIHAIFSSNPLYKPVSISQFRLLYNSSFSRKLCPFSSVLIRDQQSGMLAAISLCHPNYQFLFPAKTSPEFNQDFSRLEWKILLAKTVGVHPDFRQHGLMNFMGAYGMRSFRENYDEVIFCLMRTGNHSLHFTDSLLYESVKYALYEKKL